MFSLLYNIRGTFPYKTLTKEQERDVTSYTPYMHIADINTSRAEWFESYIIYQLFTFPSSLHLLPVVNLAFLFT